MCHQCNYNKLLERGGLAPTPNRLKILEVVGNNNSPLNAQEIFEILIRNNKINRVTVYRILDLLVEKGIVKRLSGGGRSFHYGLAPNDNHQPHPHFYCKQCGNMECLSPQSLTLDMEPLNLTFPGMIDDVEVCLDGTCKNCLKLEKKDL